MSKHKRVLLVENGHTVILRLKDKPSKRSFDEKPGPIEVDIQLSEEELFILAADIAHCAASRLRHHQFENFEQLEALKEALDGKI